MQLLELLNFPNLYSETDTAIIYSFGIVGTVFPHAKYNSI